MDAKNNESNFSHAPEQMVRFPARRAIFRVGLSFALFAYLSGRARIFAGLLTALPFLLGMFFRQNAGVRKKSVICLLSSFAALAASAGILFAAKEYTFAALFIPWLSSVFAFALSECTGRRAAEKAASLRMLLASAVLFCCFLT